MFTLMMLFNTHMKEIAFTYGALVLFTALQRLREALEGLGLMING